MSTHLSLENFNEIYNNTYNRTLRYIVCKCSNIDDVNDLIQETYIELYKKIKKNEHIMLENCQNYVIGIAKLKIQKHYGLLYKIKTTSIFINKDLKEYEMDIPSNIDLETDIVAKLDAEKVWNYIKKKKTIVIKIFYLYYYSDLKISQIANELNIKESNVKNILYRTLKDIKEKLKEEGDIIV